MSVRSASAAIHWLGRRARSDGRRFGGRLADSPDFPGREDSNRLWVASLSLDGSRMPRQVSPQRDGEIHKALQRSWIGIRDVDPVLADFDFRQRVLLLRPLPDIAAKDADDACGEQPECA